MSQPNIDVDAVTELQVAIYLDGLTSGVASALQTFFQGMPDETIELQAQGFSHALRHQALDSIKLEIAERIAGIDGDSKEPFQIFPPDQAN